jgi:hypothetical protein
MPAKTGHAPVAFNEEAWSEDLLGATDAARTTAARLRARLERDGQAVTELLACSEEGRDGTSLPGCVKTYVSWPDGPWGIVYLIACDESGRLSLDHLAFGLRHPPPGHRASVYKRAHWRLNEDAAPDME